MLIAVSESDPFADRLGAHAMSAREGKPDARMTPLHGSA